MKRKLLILFLCLCLFHRQNFAQDKSPVKFGKISPEDFKPTVYSIDSNASAVIIADIGSTEIIGNTKGFFSLEYKHYRRVHILNKNGYDIANVSISLFTRGEKEEQLESLKAVTYNIENGKVTETKLDTKDNVFKDKVSKSLIRKKFTFPNLKEGSIIEYEYRVQSDFLFNLQPWEFQGSYPRLWSEYNVSIPDFINYVFITQGYQGPAKERKDSRHSFSITDNNGAGASEHYNFSAAVVDYRWYLKNVPALKEESFTTTLDNHIDKIEFQLSEYRDPLTPKNVMGTWPQLTKDLMEADYFGAPLSKDNGWMGDVIGAIVKSEKDKLTRSKKIFAFVRDNFTCTSYHDIYLNQTLKNIVKGRKGSVSEINLLLVAMLRYADIAADPVMLSTRDNGYSYALYPLIDKFNYVIVQATIDDKLWYLDASEPRIGFGKLGSDCYNGHARVINPEATALGFYADSLQERKLTSVFIINDDKGNLSGSMQQSPGYYESYSIRNKVKEKGTDPFFADIKKEFNADVEISHPIIDSLYKYDDPVAIKYDFNIKQDKEDIIYFNPMFGEGYKENPFKSAERFYPVEMPYTMDETYLMQLQVPEGYVIDELPKQLVVKLNENDDGMFEYRIAESGGTISLRSRLRLKRAYFQPDEYEMLREFFNLVVKKHNEQIVFKKKK